jgi:hypothetical protein
VPDLATHAQRHPAGRQAAANDPSPLPQADADDFLNRLARPGRLSPLAARHLRRALARDEVTSDALLQVADMAEEASQSYLLLPWYRRDFRQLAQVMREIAPAFAGRPLPRGQDQALSAQTLSTAAGILAAFGGIQTLGVERMLRVMALRMQRGVWPA